MIAKLNLIILFFPIDFFQLIKKQFLFLSKANSQFFEFTYSKK